MIRSMLAAVSGMRSHQTFLDVIGNNIANVNTIGFKASRIIFADMLSQMTRKASASQDDRSGTNPVQIGLGMEVGGVETLMTQGNFQSTGKATDLAIDGEGFFVVYDGSRNYFTRDGSFDLAVDGTLASPITGMKVRGWLVGTNGQIDNTGPLTSIVVPFGETLAGQASKSATVKGNLNAAWNGFGQVTASDRTAGTGAVSGVFTGNASTDYVVKIVSTDTATGEVTGIQVSSDGGVNYGATIAASGGSAVDIGNGLKFAIASNTGNVVGTTYSFTAKPPVVETSIGAYDSLGNLHNVKLTLKKTAENNWTWVPSTTEAGVSVEPTTAQAFSFRPNGTYQGQIPAGTITLTLTNGANSPLSVNLDLSGLTQLSSSTEATATADGGPPGTLTSFSVGKGGDITGIYSNGFNRLIGQIALAQFANPSGLIRMGQNLYDTSPNSGQANIGAPGVGDRGDIGSGFLEMSNVDLSQQFTNLIMAERGFQANSRVISTLAEVLQDLVNLQR